MHQENFESRNSKLWNDYNTILKQLDMKTPGMSFHLNVTDFPLLYRNICNHYAMALSRQYSPALVAKLHTMVLSGHKKLYKTPPFRIAIIAEFFTTRFPVTFRKNISYFVIALMLFLIPFAGTGISCYFKHDLIYSIMSQSQVSDFEFMYDPANKKTGRTQDRSSDKDVAMFGHYIKNNISIGFRTFAGGMFAGAGSVFFLIFNGIILGGVSGHVTRLGFTETFWPFVSGHGAFELTAIIISGMAGLVLAKAIIAPGNYKRADALKQAAQTALNLMFGAAAMLLIAAFIEAFWSSSGLSIGVKYIAAGCFWLMVFIYLSLAGRKAGCRRAMATNEIS